MNDDAVIYLYGRTELSIPSIFEFSKLCNPYSWSIEYYDDWRCIVDILKVKQKEKKEKS